MILNLMKKLAGVKLERRKLGNKHRLVDTVEKTLDRKSEDWSFNLGSVTI